MVRTKEIEILKKKIVELLAVTDMPLTIKEIQRALKTTSTYQLIGAVLHELCREGLVKKKRVGDWFSGKTYFYFNA